MAPKKSKPITIVTPAPVKCAAYEGADDEFFRSAVHTIQLVHQSVANHPNARKLFIDRLKEDKDEVVVALRHLVIGVLKQAPAIPAEALRRHNGFLRDLCKSIKETLKSDHVSFILLEALLPYGHAANKSVRLHVVSTFDELLRTLDPTINTDERQAFYNETTQMLKNRIYDTCPAVRERAVAAIAAFQIGTKDDDVTCNMISVLIEDSSADVRRQVLRGIQSGNGSKEFLHVYFAAMLRSTLDVVAKVREAAWEALHRFKWSHINHYCKREGIDCLHHIALGLDDSSVTVRTACRLTVTKSWLQRDMKEDCTAFLDAIAIDFRAVDINLVSAQRVAKELLEFNHKCHPQSRDETPYHLRYIKDEHEGKGLTFGNVLMWKSRCVELVYQVDAAEDDEAQQHVLVPLPVFHEVLQDVIMLFAKPESFKSKVIHLEGTEVEEVLRLLLSMLEVYSDGGFLAHTDNHTRSALLKQLGFLLKVVPDTDPSLFVDLAMKSIRLMTARHAEEASSVVHDALSLLFSGVQLRKEHGLTLEDAESLDKLDADRRQKLSEFRKKYGAEDEEVRALEQQVYFDQKFLLRMQHIVLYFLSYASRLERVPPFCMFVVQLGRHQCDAEVRVIATRSLGLLCLISPEAVHTFFPVLLTDAAASSSDFAEVAATPDTDVPSAALAGAFDIVSEYGFKLFDQHSERPPPPKQLSVDIDLEAHNRDAADREKERQEAELAAQGEAIQQRGGAKMLRKMLVFLTSRCIPQRQVAILGFCKLLACNRVPVERAPSVIAQLLAHSIVEPTVKKGSSVVAQQVSRLVHTFLNSYSASSGLRQGFIAEGGLQALRLLLYKLPNALTQAQRLLMQVLRLTDAANLKQVRDTDPEYAQQVATEYRQEADGEVATVATTTTTTVNANSVNATTGRMNAIQLARQVGHFRLRHELSRLSLHEYIAMELLVEVASNPTSSVAVRLASQILPKLRFYCTLPSVTQQLVAHCEAAVRALPRNSDVAALFQEILETLVASHRDATSNHDASNANDTNVQDVMPRRALSVEERLRLRAAFEDSLEGRTLVDGIFVSVEDDDGDSAMLHAFAASNSTLGFSQEALTMQAVSRLAAPASNAATRVPSSQAEDPKPTAAHRKAEAVASLSSRQRNREGDIELDDILGGRKKARKN